MELDVFIEKIKNKHVELERKNWDWRAFYNGALEAFSILHGPKHETVEQLRNQFECEYQKHDLSRLDNGLYNLVDINLLWDTWVRCARKNNIISGNQ